jgi:flagellar assembly protein FliH
MAGGSTVRLAGRVARVAVVPPPGGAAAGGRPEGAEASPDVSAARQLQQQMQQIAAQKQQLAQALSALQSALAQIPQLQAQIQQQAEAQLLDLAMEIASKVLMQQVQAQRYEIEPIIRAALEHLPPRTPVTVHLNPRDLEQIQAAVGTGGLGEHVKLLADASVAPAECLVQTDQGSVAGSIEGGLAAVAAAMKGDRS